MVTATKQIHTCYECGYKGTDLRSEPTFRNGREFWEWFCIDTEACLDRQGYYPRQKAHPGHESQAVFHSGR